MADDRFQLDQNPDEDLIDNIDLGSDLDNEVTEDVINPRPVFRPAKRPSATPGATPTTPNPSRPLNDVRPTEAAKPGQTRSPDPQKRDQVEPNKLSPTREAWNKARDRVGKGMDDINQARALAGEKLDKLRTAQAIVSDPKGAAKEYVGDKIKEEAKRRGTQAVKQGAKAASRVAKIAGQAVLQAVRSAGVWLIGVLGPWGVAILAIIIVIGIGAALLWQNDSGSNVQVVDMDKPGMADAVSRLAALAGDADALAKQIKDNTSTVTTALEQARTETANAPLKEQITQEIDNANALVERIRAGGSSLTTAEITKLANALIYSLQRIPALYRGMSITTANELVAAANNEVRDGASKWVYSDNQQTSNTSQPMRDGTNEVGGKKGCNSSGFVTYLLRGNNTRCAQCVSPTLDSLAATFSLLQAATQTDTANDVSYLKGDILVASVPSQKSLEGYIVTNVTTSNGNAGVEVAYCSATGPVKANLKQVLEGSQPGRKGDGQRTIKTQYRLINEQRSGLSASGGSS